MKKKLMSSKKLTKSPTFQQVFQGIQKADAYGGIFPEMYKLINIMLTLPVGTATVERSFRQMKMTKTRLHNRPNDTNLKRLMRIAMSTEMKLVDFDEVLDVFRENNRRISL